MRAPLFIAAMIAGLAAGTAAACAADLSVEAPAYENCCYAVYGAAAPVVILDDQPGVVIRRWWLPPWHHVHYFPHGRERLHTETRWQRPRPGPSFSRYWSNPPVYVIEAPLIHPGVPAPEPLRRYPQPAKATH